MANNGDPRKESLQAQADQLHNTAELGHSSDLVLKALEPIVERRLGTLLDQFSTVAPELGPMLDLRAQISEVWRIRRELKSNIRKGQSATETIRKILGA